MAKLMRKISRARKSQIKMGETIAVMVIFFFLLVFGLGFYARLQQHSLEQEAVRQLQMRSVQVALKASSMPELQYGIEDGTLDLMKVGIFNAFMQDDEQFMLYYFDVFGYSEIYVNQTYPVPEDYLIYRHLPQETGFYQLIESPVSLYNPASGEYSFGILGVKLYSR